MSTNRRWLVAAVIAALAIGVAGVVIGVVVVSSCEPAPQANDRPGSNSDSYIGKGIEKIKERLEGCSDSDDVDATSSESSDLFDKLSGKSYDSDASSPTASSRSSTTTVLSATHNSPVGASIGLYNAWVSGDRAEAANFGNARGVEQLFAYAPGSRSPAHANPDCGGGDDMVACRFGKVSMYLATPVQTSVWRVTYVEVDGTPIPTTTTTTPGSLDTAGALIARALYDHWQAGDRAGAAAFATESVIEGLFKHDPAKFTIPGDPRCTDSAQPFASRCAWDAGATVAGKDGPQGLLLLVSKGISDGRARETRGTFVQSYNFYQLPSSLFATTGTTTPGSAASSEIAATTLHQNWQSGDRVSAAKVADDDVVEKLFARDPAQFTGFGAPRCSNGPRYSDCDWTSGGSGGLPYKNISMNVHKNTDDGTWRVVVVNLWPME